MEKEIDFVECKWVLHKPVSKVQGLDKTIPDTHYVKEKVTFKDGSSENRLRLIKNYKRPIWITRPEFRKYKQKKEAEDLEKVFEVKTTESEKYSTAARILKYKKPIYSADSPYLYGIDVKAGVFIKKAYLDKYPDKYTPYTIACLDIENDVDTGEITVITVVRHKEIHTVILKSLVARYANVKQTILQVAKEHMPDADQFKYTIKVLDSELDLVKESLKILHEWGPDFVSIWNMDYDLTAILNVLEKYGVRPEDVFSDPKIPVEDRYFNYKRGMAFRMSTTGKKKASDIQDRWNTVVAPAKFYWVDGMVVYNYVRVNTKKLPNGYGLDSVIEHEMGEKFKKLKFPNLNDGDYIKVDWHRFMSKKHPIEYIVYNMWDAMSMIYLDEHIGDLKSTFPLLSDVSMLEDFSRSPIQSINAMLFFFMEHGKVIGSKPITWTTRKSLGTKDFIITLPNRNYNSRVSKGILLEDLKKYTNISRFVFDLDQVSAYPMDQIVLNSSGDTTMLELISVGNYDKTHVIMENVNLFSGEVASITYCRNMFKMPSLYDIDKIAKEMKDEDSNRITA